MKNKEIDVDQVIKTIDTTLNDFKEDLYNMKLTKEEAMEVLQDIKELEEKALRIKLDIERDHLLSLLENNKMNLSAKELKIVCSNIENINNNIQSFSNYKEHAA